jgi:hypothetical protein
MLTRFFRLGVPYHAWRITHSKHHASTGHMTQDQVFVPPTRSELGLRPFDPSKEDLLGSRVTDEVKKEMWEALGDSPIGAAMGSASYLVNFSLSTRLLKYSFCVFTARRLACLHPHERLWSKEVSKGYHSSVYRNIVKV